MDIREWSLILFTILTQMAVGSFVILGAIHFWAARKHSQAEADRLTDRALLAIGPVLVLGMLASLFHLGNPLSAPIAVTNLATSWLSREILFAVLFAGFGALFAFLQWRKLGSFTLRNIVAWIAAILGLILVYAMAKVYMLETQPAWNTVATPILFFTTALLLGALAMGAALVTNYAILKRKDPSCAEVQCELVREITKGVALTGIILLGVELLVVPLHLAYLAASSNVTAISSAAMLYDQFAVMFGLRLVLVFVGAGVFGLFLYRMALDPGREQMLGRLIYLAFALVLISEIVGRFLFYATHAKIGI
jgi:anaerobic dimethyl sulfoxide reductase subunit C